MADSQQASITLHWLDKSRAQRIVWLLEKLNLKYDVETYHREPSMLAPSALARIHPLGHSPIVTVGLPAQAGEPQPEKIVLAESGIIMEYLMKHFPESAKELQPTQWKAGMEGKIGGETKEWMRYQYYLQYVEGSLMPILVAALLIGRLKTSDVPFIVRPITWIVANRVFSIFLFPNAKRHLAMIDEHLQEFDGPYLCGKTLTAADIMLAYPLMAARDRLNDFGYWDSPDKTWQKAHPKVLEYINTLEREEGYLRSVKKIEAIDGSFTGYNL